MSKFQPKERPRRKPHQTPALVFCMIAFQLRATASLPYIPTGSALDFLMADPAYSMLGAALMNRSIVSPEAFAFLQSPLKG